MTDCLKPLVTSAYQWRLADKSGVYNAVNSAANVEGASVGVESLARPVLPNFTFAVDIGPTSAAKLLDPGTYIKRGTPPVLGGTSPSLEGVTYNAVMSTIALGHKSGVLDDITYQKSLDSIDLPDDEPDSAPKNYPERRPEGDAGDAGLPDLVAPEFELGDRPGMLPIQPIDFEPSGIEPIDLSDYMPEYEPPDVSELDWQPELGYEEDANLRSKLQQLMEGADEIAHWIGATVQGKLYQSDIRELERRTKTQIDKIMDQTAGANFSLPHGPAEQLVLQVAGEELEESYKASQRIRDEVFDAAVKQYHFKLYMRYLRQNLRVYQLNLELATKAYNALVEIYGLIERSIGVHVDAYNQYVSAVNAENRAITTQVAFTEAEVATYRARVQMYASEVGLRQKSAQVQKDDVRNQALVFGEYQAQLRGTMADLEIVQTNIEGFQEAVRAYSNQTQWYDSALSAYDAHVDAGLSQISVDESKFENYRRLWAAEGDRMGAYREYLQASTSAMDASLRDHRAAVQAQQSYLSSINESLGASLQAVSSYSQAAGVSARHVGSFNAADVSYISAQNDVNVAEAVADMSEDAIAVEAKAQYAKLDAANEAAKVTAAGALAQASSAIFQVGLSATGSSSERVSGRDTGSERYSRNQRKDFSKVCTYVERPMEI